MIAKLRERLDLRRRLGAMKTRALQAEHTAHHLRIRALLLENDNKEMARRLETLTRIVGNLTNDLERVKQSNALTILEVRKMLGLSSPAEETETIVMN